MTDAEEIREQVPAAGLDVQLAAELIERAKAQGVSLVGHLDISTMTATAAPLIPFTRRH